MTPEETLASYRSAFADVGEDVTIRRYTGTGSSRTHVDTVTKGYARDYLARELQGGILQGDFTVCVQIDSLSAILPILTSDKVLIADRRESAIKTIKLRKDAGILVAIDLEASG